MSKAEYKSDKLQFILSDMQHEMLIHGFLLAVQRYAVEFGLHGTAIYILKTSGALKENLIRCQLANGFENELMLGLIEKAFELE